MSLVVSDVSQCVLGSSPRTLPSLFFSAAGPHPRGESLRASRCATAEGSARGARPDSRALRLWRTRFLPAGLAPLALAAVFGSGQPALAASITIGGITAEPGTVVSRMVPIPGVGDDATSIPVTVVHGKEPGPVLALIAGNHGYEYAPILALQRLLSRISPTELRGTVVLVHVAAMPSFLARTVYRSPVDGKNLNRVYPGKQKGSSSERIAYFITEEVIEKASYVIDLHCGDGNEWLRPFVYMPVTGEAAIDAKIEELVTAFGMDHILVDRSRPADPESSRFCDATAITRGIPAFTAESGSLGQRDDASVDRLVNGVVSVLRHYRLLEGAPAPVTHPVFLEPSEVLTSPKTGVLHPRVEPGNSVAAGSLLAIVTDFFGNELARVSAPFAGEVLYVVATPPISEGEPVAMIGVPKR